jgi:hypothetical protein
MLNIKSMLVACAIPLTLAACSASTDSTTDETQPTEETSQDLSSKKCKGPLPALCQVCSDGTTACAHWVVEHGVCTVEICPPPPPHTCVQNVFCIAGSHFDTTKCQCVPNTCVQKVLCVATAHWDSARCQCVPN